jgi:hypothetical protein
VVCLTSAKHSLSEALAAHSLANLREKVFTALGRAANPSRPRRSACATPHHSHITSHHITPSPRRLSSIQVRWDHISPSMHVNAMALQDIPRCCVCPAAGRSLPGAGRRRGGPSEHVQSAQRTSCGTVLCDAIHDRSQHIHACRLNHK